MAVSEHDVAPAVYLYKIAALQFSMGIPGS
jgi:hypothetical protein